MKKESFSIRSLIIVVSITTIGLVPFITKAFHIDDTLFLWCAKQIQANPVDFYGFTVNWYGVQQPMFLINQNPPLVSYFISGVASLFGWTETVLHIAFLIPGVCFSIGMYFLARFLCPLPYLAALIAVISPVFLVSSTNVMTDSLFLTLYVWSAVLWLYGMERDKSLYFLCACILISLSALTKYFGMSLIPLLFVYSLVAKRKLGVWVLFLIIPLLILIGYELLTFSLYNNFLISNSAAYAIKVGGADKIALFITKTFKGLSYAGGCMVGILFFTHLMWSRRALKMGMLFLLLFITALFGMESVRAILLPNVQNIRYELIIQYALFTFAGIQILLLATVDILKNRTPESLLLFLWVFGTFLFASQVNWTVNARTILPMIPAVGILVMRRLNEKIDFKNPSKAFQYIWPLIPAAIIALSVTWADVSIANAQRSAARRIHDEFSGYPHTIWFQGHWGFQYYMESYGAKALDLNKSIVKKGDIIIIPINNTNVMWLPENKYHSVGKRQLRPCRWIGTMSRKNGAGFYADIYGPLPFSIGDIEPEEYFLFLAGNFKNPAEAIKDFGGQLKAGHF
jgi:4-amino-4-deoxy-L-arabinose transferase-like glycosyltransferase